MEQCITARAGSPLVGARLQGDIRGCTFDGIATGLGIVQSHDFCMCLPSRLRLPFTQQLTIGRGDHTANPRIRRGDIHGLGGKHQSPVHVDRVYG
jgi:hypothetical protein